MIPTTLSMNTYDQLFDYYIDKNYQKKKIYAFFSMVEKRKKLHQDVMCNFTRSYKRILKNSIPALSEIERMGINREPVVASSPSSRSTAAYRGLWNEIREIIRK